MSGVPTVGTGAPRRLGAPRRVRIGLLGMALALGLGLPAPAAAAPAAAAEAAAAPAAGRPRVLVFHGTAGERHASIPAGIQAIERLGKEHGFEVDETQDPGAFTAGTLARYRAVVFLSAGGDVLDAEQEAAFQAYVRAGGGFVGVHGAARAEPESAWFTGLVGTRPGPSPAQVQEAVVEVGDRVHPATRGLPVEWVRADEWLNWDPNPASTVHTVARVRERSYAPGEGANGWNHPISWCRDYDGGRSFYTGMGHTAESYRERHFLQHLLGGILWAAGMVRGDCQATIAANYRATRLTPPNQPGQLDQIGEPHGLAIAEDGRVFYIGRGGRWPGAPVVTDWEDPQVGLGEGTIHMWDPRTGQVHRVATLDVFGNKGNGPEHVKSEEGLVGIALDPDFLDNGWIYLYYMPHRSIDRERRVGKRTVSRFTFDHDTGTLDLSSEKVILQWDAQIDRCCHAGGGMAFDSEGNLYIAVGDNNSSQCDGCGGAAGGAGYSGNNPVPEFMGLSQQDARRTAGNTNDLNGKILRIKPRKNPSGPPGPGRTYTIPKGNLFTGREGGGGKARPEIYVMGVRNPTRLAVDPRTGWLLAGWVGPDASTPSRTWGPAKYETLAAITKAGNQGWPYCMADKQPYRDRDPVDVSTPRGWYGCDDLRNESPRNTGLVRIPPARANTMWYSPQGGGPVFPRGAGGVPSYDLAEQSLTQPYLNGGGAQAVMPGPLYRYDRESTSPVKWPEYWDGKWFIGDFYANRSRIAVILDPKTGADGVLDAPVHVEDLKPMVPATSQTINHLMDWKFGPDGALYVLDYGNGFFTADAAAALWRVTYHGGPPTPAPAATATPALAGHPLTVAFSSGRSGGVAYEWDFGDGSRSHEPNPTHTYTAPGRYTATLTVRYADGERAVARTEVNATCAAPDARPTVMLLDTDSGVPNRQAGGGCTINDLIDDERRWDSQGRFLAHVAEVASVLERAGVIGGDERRRLVRAAARSRIGHPHGPEPYQLIFDGTAASLARWVQAPSGSFELQPDGSIRSAGGLGMLWYAAQAYGDFSLRLQFRDARTDGGHSNSGVLVRFPDPRTPLEQRPPGSCGTVGPARTSPAWVAIYCGQEVQIYDGPAGEPQKTGSIYNFQPLDLERARPTPPGVWNDYEVRVVGQHYTVLRNGVVINEFDNTPGKASSRPGDPPTDLRQFLSGFIGLQNHGALDRIEFRNVRVRNLSP